MCLPVSCPHRGICKGAVPRPNHLALGTPPPSVAGPCHNPWSQTKMLYCNKLPLVACVTFMPWVKGVPGKFAGAASSSTTSSKTRGPGSPVYRGPPRNRGPTAAGQTKGTTPDWQTARNGTSGRGWGLKPWSRCCARQAMPIVAAGCLDLRKIGFGAAHCNVWMISGKISGRQRFTMLPAPRGCRHPRSPGHLPVRAG